MNKQIFYLKDCDNPEFFSCEPHGVICWVYRWEGAAGKQVAYSVDLHTLIENYYYEN
jgi:hypothetical protein